MSCGDALMFQNTAVDEFVVVLLNSCVHFHGYAKALVIFWLQPKTIWTRDVFNLDLFLTWTDNACSFTIWCITRCICWLRDFISLSASEMVPHSYNVRDSINSFLFIGIVFVYIQHQKVLSGFSNELILNLLYCYYLELVWKI